MKKNILLISITLIILPTLIYAAVTDYLILQDIGLYKLDKPEKFLPGEPPSGGPRSYDSAGIISGAGHFPDHVDKTYEVMYLGGDANASPTVQVTQHAGSDSDKWLLHEVEDSYRSGDMERLGLLSQGTIIKTIGNNRYFSIRLGGGAYMWVSNNAVVKVDYTSIEGGKPEPIEVVQAYLQKFPSTIPSTLILDKSHDEQWIKDEMDRRLWLCDKWFEQLQLGKAEQSQVLEEVVKSMNVFLDYREKYYGLKASSDKNALEGYLDTKDETNIRNKLNEYKTWWSANKSGSLIGVLSIYTHRIWGHVSHFVKTLYSFFASLLERLLAVFG